MVVFNYESNQWCLHPFYYNKYMMQLEVIQYLRETINKKWTKEESTSYVTFLDHLTTYIQYYILGVQISY
jgi:hypothetical protein